MTKEVPFTLLHPLEGVKIKKKIDLFIILLKYLKDDFTNFFGTFNDFFLLL